MFFQAGQLLGTPHTAGAVSPNRFVGTQSIVYYLVFLTGGSGLGLVRSAWWW